MDILEKKVGSINVISLTGRLDAYRANDLEEKLDALIDAGQVHIMLRLENLEYISSSGLRVFLAALKKTKKQEGDIKLVGLTPFIREIFDIAGFTKLFHMFDTEEDAINKFGEV